MTNEEILRVLYLIRVNLLSAQPASGVCTYLRSYARAQATCTYVHACLIWSDAYPSSRALLPMLILPRLHVTPARGADPPRVSDSARGLSSVAFTFAPARGADSPRGVKFCHTHNAPLAAS